MGLVSHFYVGMVFRELEPRCRGEPSDAMA
jgi:hypothetical protein